MTIVKYSYLRMLGMFLTPENLMETKTRLDLSSPALFVDLQPGTILGGQYEIKRLIAKGGMGAIYEAYQSTLDRNVALKILPPYLAKKPKFIEQFKKEAMAAAKIEHPNIVPIYGIGNDNDIHYFIMALVVGKTVEQMIRERRRSLIRTRKIIPLDESLSIVRQVATALDFAHSKGVVHRDIKPSNIIIDPNGKVVVTDFGLAKIRTAETQPQAGDDLFMGTPIYMSPEQARRDKVDHRSDIYSLGIVLFELLSGHPPLPMGLENESDIMNCVMNGQIISIRNLVPKIDERLEAIVDMALMHDASDRYQTINAFLSDIERFNKGLDVIAQKSRRVPVGGGNKGVEELTVDPSAMEKKLKILLYVLSALLILALAANVHFLKRTTYAKQLRSELLSDLNFYKSEYNGEYVKNANVCYEAGKEFLELGKYRKAEKYFRILLQDHPYDPRVIEISEILLKIKDK